MNIQDSDPLNRPHSTSFVAIARIVSTSTIISTIISVIALVGGIPVYISSRRKKRSMRFKISTSFSRLALASLAAWRQCQSRLSRETLGTDQKKNPDSRKNCIRRRECLEKKH